MPTYQTIQALATTSSVTIFTATAIYTQVYDLSVKNIDTSNDIRLTIAHVKSGETESSLNRFVYDIIKSDDNKPLFNRPVLATGDKINISASITNKLAVFITLLELE
jgi:hypothetical protein